MVGAQLKYGPLPACMSRKSATSPTQPANYGDAVQQLERMIDGLESGQLPLEELLGQYQRGTRSEEGSLLTRWLGVATGERACRPGR